MQDVFWCSYLKTNKQTNKQTKNIPWKVPWETILSNVTPNIEQILSFELFEKTHFQEIFHWVDMCNMS